MQITLILFFTFISFGDIAPVGHGIVGEWVGSETRLLPAEFEMGGEDFQKSKIERPSIHPKSITVTDRKFVFQKDGTGTFRDSKFVREPLDLKFSWLLVENEDSTDYQVFLSFEAPYKSERNLLFTLANPLLVIKVKKAALDEIFVTSIKQNSPLGDRLKNIRLVRSQTK